MFDVKFFYTYLFKTPVIIFIFSAQSNSNDCVQCWNERYAAAAVKILTIWRMFNWNEDIWNGKLDKKKQIIKKI